MTESISQDKAVWLAGRTECPTEGAIMSTPRFLLLEDKLRDVEAIQTVLTNGGINCGWGQVDTCAAFVTALEAAEFDLILAAYAMPGFDGMAALEIARNLCPETPFIFVSASLGEELAIETLKQGATDYVLKQRLERLVPCVQRALREAQERRERKQAEATLQQTSDELERQVRKFDATLSTITDSVFTFDRDGRFLYTNQVLLDLWGLSADQAIGKTMADLNYPPTVERQVLDDLQQVLETRESVRNETPYINPAGVEGYFEYILSPVFAVDRTVESVIGLSRDISDRKRVEDERKQAEAALQESETQTRNILESITDGFFALDQDWRFTYLNSQAERLLDRTPGDLLGKVVWEEYPGAVGTEFERAYRQTASDRVASSFTSFYPDHNCWYEVNAYPAADGITVYFRNVTEQMQAVAALRESEEKTRNILESIAEAFFALDENWQFAYMNQSGEALLDRCDLIGKNFWEEYPGVAGSEFETVYRRAMNYRVPGTLTAFYPDHDRWYDIRTYPAANGIAVYFSNVTEQIKTEAALRESESRLRFMLDASQIGEWDLDLTTEPYTAHRSLRHDQIFGYETLLPAWSYEIFLTHVHPDDRAGVNEKFQQTLSASTNWNFECRVIHPDQSLHWIWVRSSVYCDSSGTPTRLLGMVVDITDRKQSELERERLLAAEQQARSAAEASREEAQAANRIRDEFLAVLSHELRSPLNPILGWARLLQNGKLDTTRQAEALKTIERNAKLQSQLIEDLLDISRIMQGKLSLTATPVSLTFVISAALETVRSAAEAKQIQITLALDPIASVSGDVARLQQVVWNLLTNAVKFTPSGGQVTVELRQTDRLAQLRLIDTGKGISPNFLPHMFEYFRQEDGSTTRRFGGLGLGLAIVRQIVELHGGTVWAESQGENQGATFVVQLPVMPQATSIASEPARTQADTEALLDNVQILLVDDETDTREFQTFLLKQNGAKVTAVASGLEALQALDQWLPDLIVSDIGMAKMDGYMLIEQIRSRPPTQGGAIPAIALTAYAAELDQQRALEAGLERHLTKLLEPERFVSEIVHLLKQKRA